MAEQITEDALDLFEKPALSMGKRLSWWKANEPPKGT